MRLFKTKFTPKILKVVINLTVITTFLSHFATPLAVKATVEQNMANSTQKIANGEVISQGKAMPTVKLAMAGGLMRKDKPDKVIKAVITSYTSTPDQTDDTPFIAASGKRVHDGMIAANGLPFGTKIKIPSVYGDKIFIVEDRMNSRYGFGRFDVWLDTTKAEARKFGVKRVQVEIFYPEKMLSRAGK